MKHLQAIIIIILLLALGYLAWTTRHCLRADGPQVITKTDTIYQDRTVQIPAFTPTLSEKRKTAVPASRDTSMVTVTDTIHIYRDTLRVPIHSTQTLPAILSGINIFGGKKNRIDTTTRTVELFAEHHTLGDLLSSEYRINFPEKLIKNHRNIYLTEPRHQFYLTTDFATPTLQGSLSGAAEASPLQVTVGVSYIRSDIMLRYGYNLTTQSHQFGAGFRLFRFY